MEKTDEALPEGSPKIRYLGDLQRLELKPGDQFVLMVPNVITEDSAKRVQDAWRKFVGGDDTDLKLFIIDGGMKLGIMNLGSSKP